MRTNKITLKVTAKQGDSYVSAEVEAILDANETYASALGQVEAQLEQALTKGGALAIEASDAPSKSLPELPPVASSGAPAKAAPVVAGKPPKASTPAPATAAPASPSKPAAGKVKLVAFDRAVPNHQSAMKEIASAEFPGWTGDSEILAKVKEAAVHFTESKTPFMNATDGQILQDFVTAFRKFVTAAPQVSVESVEI